MGKRIVIMAGGTGGHVFPALAVALTLKEQGWQVSWLGTHKGLESRVVPEKGIDIDWLSVSGIRGKGLLSKLSAAVKLLIACIQAVKVLMQRKPDVVLGMGGFVAGPGGLMAKVLRIPLVIHEQNRVPGTTNKILARMAKQVLEAFPGSFPKDTNAICTGNPLRSDIAEMPVKATKEAGTKLKILVLGGSQGAQVLNQIVPEAIAALEFVEVKHQSGVAMQTGVAGQYRALNIEASVSVFIDDMASTYQWADMIICRAGAMTVSEVAAAGLPAIFIPLPHAIDDHQTANAKYLVDVGAGIMIKQSELSATILTKEIVALSKKLEVTGKAARASARLNATADVAAICVAEVAA